MVERGVCPHKFWSPPAGANISEILAIISMPSETASKLASCRRSLLKITALFLRVQRYYHEAACSPLTVLSSSGWTNTFSALLIFAPTRTIAPSSTLVKGV